MAFTNKDKKLLTPNEYAELRKNYSQKLKEYYKDKTKHPCYGKHISEEQKNIISKANKGNQYCVGRVLSKETKEKIGKANSNPSKETREKMSKAQKARNLNGGNNPRAKQVIRLSDNKIYSCAKEAAEDNHINYSTFKKWVRENKNGFQYL